MGPGRLQSVVWQSQTRLRPGFDPWLGKIPWRRKQQPTPALLPGKSHGWRSLVGYSPWGRKESDTAERLQFTSLHIKRGFLHSVFDNGVCICQVYQVYYYVRFPREIFSCALWPSVCLPWRKVCLGLLTIFFYWVGLFVVLILSYMS